MQQRLLLHLRHSVAAAAAAVVGLAPTPAGAATPPLAAGRVTLGALVAGPIDVPVVPIATGSADPAQVHVTLPEGARQGPETWYVVSVHARFSFGPGRLRTTFFAKVNGHSVALEEFTAPPGENQVDWSSATLLDGPVGGSGTRRLVDVTLRNYVQVGAVQGGDNTLSFTMHNLGGAEAHAEVLPDSWVEASRDAPFDFDGDLGGRAKHGLRWTVTNTTKHPARARVVLRVGPPEALREVASAEVALRPGKTSGVLAPRHLRAGRQQVQLWLVPAGRSPRQLVGKTVMVPAAAKTAWPQLLVGGLAIASGAVLLRSRRSRKGAAPNPPPADGEPTGGEPTTAPALAQP